jgi:hypothetical protein
VIPSDLLANPLLPRAVILGVLGGFGLVITARSSRRAPVVFLPYAALLVCLGLLTARHADLGFATRSVSVFAGYLSATLELYISVVLFANADRRRSPLPGRVPPSTEHFSVSALGHAWRVATLAGAGALLSMAVAFVVA